jgi:hypothetical protein
MLARVFMSNDLCPDGIQPYVAVGMIEPRSGGPRAQGLPPLLEVGPYTPNILVSDIPT